MTMAATATDERLAADLASFRAEATRDISALRTDLAGFQGEVKSDLKWINGIGVALLLAAFSFAGWVIADMSTLKTEVRQQEARLDRIEKKLDTLIERTAPKSPLIAVPNAPG
jgi:hypothetical protein